MFSFNNSLLSTPGGSDDNGNGNGHHFVVSADIENNGDGDQASARSDTNRNFGPTVRPRAPRVAPNYDEIVAIPVESNISVERRPTPTVRSPAGGNPLPVPQQQPSNATQTIAVSCRDYVQLFDKRKYEVNFLASESKWAKFQKPNRTKHQNLINVLCGYHKMRDGGNQEKQQLFQKTVYPHYQRLKDENFPVKEINSLITQAVLNVQRENLVHIPNYQDLLDDPLPVPPVRNISIRGNESNVHLSMLTQNNVTPSSQRGGMAFNVFQGQAVNASLLRQEITQG